MKLKDCKNILKYSKQINDIVNDFSVIKNMEYGDAVRYVMKKYSCDLEKAYEIVDFTRVNDSIC